MVVAFIGHSEITFDDKLRKLIYNHLKKIIEQNKEIEFYLGSYSEFDSQCNSILRELKKYYANFKTVFITPYLYPGYSRLENAKYLYDETLYPPIENAPARFAISRRNEWMIDNCDFLFCYVSKSYGGAYRAFRRAVNKKIPYINFAEKELKKR